MPCQGGFICHDLLIYAVICGHVRAAGSMELSWDNDACCVASSRKMCLRAGPCYPHGAKWRRALCSGCSFSGGQLLRTAPATPLHTVEGCCRRGTQELSPG